MKKEYRIFFAIPFDPASMNLYERISLHIREQYPQLALTIVIGNEEVGPSPEYSTFTSFKAQNRLLINQFVAQIQRSDIIIADLTNDNPNVHVELGIALAKNKNVLRVTGRSFTQLGFDIQGLEVRKYDNEEKLGEIIIGYLGTFFRIKQLDISSDHDDLYWKEPTEIQLRPERLKGGKNYLGYRPIRDDKYVMRDGAVRVVFKNVREHDREDNWFGVYFRASRQFFMGSYLLFVRPNGTVELKAYPGPYGIEPPRTYGDTKDPHTLLIEFGDSQLNVEFDSKSYLKKQNILTRQTGGHIFVGAWNADIDVHSVEMICRDTIDWS